MDVNEIDKLNHDRKGWRRAVEAQIQHLHKREKSNAKKNGETTERNSYTTQATSNTCEICEKDFKNQGGLRIHIKRMHKEARVTFACNKCGAIFKSENSKKTTGRHARETGRMKMESRHVADVTKPYRPET